MNECAKYAQLGRKIFGRLVAGFFEAEPYGQTLH